MVALVRARRSLLFVPAVRPDRYPKALATGADAVCVDLEDGVAIGAKEEARNSAVTLFSRREPTRAEVSLRINDPKTDLGQRDLEIILDAEIRPDALMLPKCDGAEEIREVVSILGDSLADLPLIVMVETARGVASAEAIASAVPTVVAVFFGAIDYSADVGCQVVWDAVLYARSRVVNAASMVGVSAIDSPFMNVEAAEMLADESRKTRALGFVGKAAIHPSQVPIIQSAFSPPVSEISWAKRIVDAYERNDGGVLLVDGKLVERPVITAAKRILAIAEMIRES